MSIINLNKLDFDQIVSVSQIAFNDKNRPKVEHKFRKALYFVFREGLLKTYNKIKSKKTDLLSEKKFYTLVIVSKDNELYGNLSTQFSEDNEDFIVSNNFFKTSNHVKLNDYIETKEKFNQFVYDSSDKANKLNERQIVQKETKKYIKGVFLYGLGDYSRVYIAPQIKNLTKIYCVDYNSNLSKFYKKSFDFENQGLVTTESYSALKRTEYPLVIIATYHSDHARLAKEIIDINPKAFVFVEKPPCVTLEDLDILLSLYSKNANVEIGYNRRHIPVNQRIREKYRNRLKVINISVKEIKINNNHWYFWENQGTRITGNLTHWIDLATYWIDEKPIEMTMLPSLVEDETIGLSILYSKGSIVNISVSDKGNSLRGVQEMIEIRSGEETVIINDYVSMKKINSHGKLSKTKFSKRNKGHENMYKHLIKTYNAKETAKYPQKDLIYTTIITFFAAKMFKENIRHINLSDKINSYF